MDTKAKSQFRLLFPCYFSFFVNGAMVLLVGAILPYIIEEAGINYSVAGGFLSAFAIGNLLASFVNPPMASRIGRKATIVVFSAFIPVMLLVITFLPPVLPAARSCPDYSAIHRVPGTIPILIFPPHVPLCRCPRRIWFFYYHTPAASDSDKWCGVLPFHPAHPHHASGH